jgi:hypothetical protein
VEPRPAAGHKPELADILWDHLGQLGHLTADQNKAIRAILECRTAALGGHVSACDACGHQDIAYNSCRNRHCPKCGALAQARWQERQERAVLPIEYHHVVFTIPQELHPLFRWRPGTAYRLLFQAANETLLEVAANQRHLGVRIGITAVLHTWTQKLTFHPHIHGIVPGGGLAPDGTWRACRPGFFLPVAVLREVFRGKLLAALERAFSHAAAPFGDSVKGILIAAAHHDWVVYAKPPVRGARQILGYLARYTHRSAISNHRIVDYDGKNVSFHYRDRADHDREKVLTLPALEFIRRYLQHVLPTGFVRIRHYGLLANACRTESVARCRELIGPVADPTPPEPPAPEAWQDLLKRLTGRDVTRCPACATGHLVRVDLVPVIHVNWALPGRATSP